ncbi:MAG: D-beta-D-heptose 1-phosphate adenosyltransferase [Actinomycetia bacterium]|nr:D-beta-D-heptose 1-phosphate adenosyltransferase [Actinomycetes bacterium]
MSRRITVVGDSLLDRDVDGNAARLCPDAPALVVDSYRKRARPGGAALAAALIAHDGVHVTLVTALADDDAGRELRALIEAAGVVVVDLGLTGSTPEKMRVLASGRTIVRVDAGNRNDPVGSFNDDARAAVAGSAAVLVADYGRGMANAALDVLTLEANARPVVWDPHPHGAIPAVGTRLVTPNELELLGFVPAAEECRPSGTLARAAHAARLLARRWQVHAVTTTLGERGAMLVHGDGPPLVVPTTPLRATDTCGAGDRFAGAAAVALADGAVMSEAVVHAVSMSSAFVASGGAGAYGDARGGTDSALDLCRERGGRSRASEVAGRVHRHGGTVVATGGCFDLLHAGHIATLRAARRLGDCLIVLVNSDASVRRLKGNDRPLQPESDRAALLEALDCVDAVEVFDEDTPVRSLEALQPDVFAKGGDYAIDELPEARALSRWGGQAVVLPYMADRSTTNLLLEARRRVH